MGRSFFPTYSLNRFGVRETGQRRTLGAAPSSGKFYQEPTPRAAMTPTGPILGAIALPDGGGSGAISPVIRRPGIIIFPGPMPVWHPPTAPPTPAAPISASGGGGAVPAPAPSPAPSASPAITVAPPPSAQQSPTPTVTVPPPSSPGTVLVSSGGGTPAPATTTIVAAPSTDLGGGVASWLGGTTPIFNYNVPNALLAGAVILGFAWLYNSGKKR